MIPSLTEEVRLLDEISENTSRLLRRFQDFVDDPDLRDLGSRFAENLKKREVNLGFNAFALASDVYHRENLHSDVMAAILDPRGSHGQGDQFLMLFLQFLRDWHQLDLDPDDYRDALIEREPGRIDVLIRGTRGDQPKAIIIENKINGAGDMDRQVVRYLETVEDGWNFKCEAIIYLTLQLKGFPGTHGWTAAQRDRVFPLLKPICAFADSSDDLHSGWLAPCIQSTADSSPEVAHVIRQYQLLILKLGRNAMNQPLMEEFYELLKDGERYKAAIQLSDIMNQLPAFRCQRLLNHFQGRSRPFSSVGPYLATTLIFIGLPIEGGGPIKIDVDNDNPTKTTVSFWDQEDRSENKLPKEILRSIGRLDDFNEFSGDRPAKTFAFPLGEAALYEFLTGFLASLQQYVESRMSPVQP